MSTAEPQSTQPPRAKARVTESQLAASLVLGLHRLVKQSTLYTTENEAQRRQLDQTQGAITAFSGKTGQNPKIHFTDKSVFVCGKLLRAGRHVYEAGLDLGRVLERFDIDEVAIGYDVSTEELRDFQQHLAEAIRGEGPSPRQKQYERIRLRRGVPPGQRGGDASAEEQLIRGYATAVIVMRRFLEKLQSGEHELPTRVRRLAEQLADLGTVESPVFLASTALYNSRHEHAGRAVNAALIALGMTRHLTDDKPLLSRLASAALLFDVGIPRVAGTGPIGDPRVGLALPRLGEEQLEELPAATATVLTCLGGMSAAFKAVTTLVYEAMHLMHHDHAGPPYGGHRPPTLEARIVAVARRFTALIADPDEELDADRAVGRLFREAEDEGQKTAVRLLMATLGLYPTGTIVELDDGTIAQVVEVPRDPRQFASPTLRRIVDASGGTAPGEHLVPDPDTGPTIVRFVDMGEPPSHPDAGDRAASAQERNGDNADAGAAEPPAAAEPAPTAAEGASEGNDDVPSMVLQAVVDGRGAQRDEDDATTDVFSGPRADVADLFFGEDDGGAEDAPCDPAPSGEPREEAPMAPEQDPEEAPGEAPPSGADRGARAPIAVGPEQSPPTTGGEAGAIAPPPVRRKGGRGRAPAGRQHQATKSGGASAPPASPPRRGGAALSGSAEGKKPSLFSGQDGGDGDGGSGPPRRQQSTSDWMRDKLSGATPTAQGTLSKTPLAHLLVYMLDRDLSGTIMLVEEDATTHLFYLDGGVPAKARTSRSVAPLDQVLLELQLLDEDTLQQSLAAISKTGELHGRYLVKQGKIDAAAIKGALTWQLVRKLGFMLRLPATTRYAFYADQNFLDDYGGPELTPIEPLSIIMTGVRTMSGSPIVERTLTRLGKTPLRLRREAALQKLALREPERAVVDLIRVRPLTLGEVIAREVAHPCIVYQTVYGLLITRYLKVGESDKPPVGAGRESIPLTLPRGRASSPSQPSAPAQPSDRSSAKARPAPRARSSSGRSEPRRRANTSRSDDEGEAPLPRRGTSSTRSGALPRRGTSSSRGGALPRRGSSSARGEPLPRRGTASTARSSPQPEDRSAEPRPRRGTASTGGAGPLPRRGTASKQPDAPEAAPSESEPQSHPARSGSLDRATIAQWSERIGDQNYFEILGVAQDAPDNQIQSAYFKLAKTWHPDRLPPELREMKTEVARIFGKINEAFQTLSNAEKRRDYTQLVASGGGTAKDREILERAVDSAMLFQKAEVLFKKGEIDRSEKMVKEAVEADPEQPEYRALLAWIQSHRLGLPDGSNPDHYAEPIAMLDEVIDAEPQFERARFYRGSLLKRMGRVEEAIKDFRVVVSLNPRNIDAAREVRLYEMRSRKKEAKPEDGGLLGRLFKKK